MKRDSLTNKSYAVRDKKGRIRNVVNKGRSNRADRRKKVGDSRIPKTKGGKAKSGYGHMGDYKKKSKPLFSSKGKEKRFFKALDNIFVDKTKRKKK